MAKYDPIGTVWKKRENKWPAVIGAVILFFIIVAVIG